MEKNSKIAKLVKHRLQVAIDSPTYEVIDIKAELGEVYYALKDLDSYGEKLWFKASMFRVAEPTKFYVGEFVTWVGKNIAPFVTNRAYGIWSICYDENSELSSLVILDLNTDICHLIKSNDFNKLIVFKFP